jgi:hypothetical protein
MDAGRVTLNALLREREWKTPNRAVFMRVRNERSFTRDVRVARVLRVLIEPSLSGGLRGCNNPKPLANPIPNSTESARFALITRLASGLQRPAETRKYAHSRRETSMA